MLFFSVVQQRDARDVRVCYKFCNYLPKVLFFVPSKQAKPVISPENKAG